MTRQEREKILLVYELSDGNGTHLLLVSDPFGETSPEKLIPYIEQSWPGAWGIRYLGMRRRVVETSVREIRAEARDAVTT